MAQYGSGWRNDPDTGVISPFGSHGGEKELLRKGKDVAETMARGRLSPIEVSLLALAKSIAGGDKGTDQFIENMCMASAGEYGFARADYLMGLARMPVPSSMPRTQPVPGGLRDRRDGQKPKQKAEADVE